LPWGSALFIFMSVQTPLEWHEDAQRGISAAWHQQLVASSQNQASRRAHAQSLGENLHAYGELDSTLRDKVGASKRLVQHQEKKVFSVEAVVAMLQESFDILETARRSFDMPLQLCVLRLEKRSKRPLREHVCDVVDAALESERAAYRDMQQRVTEAQQLTTGESDRLTKKLEALRQDVDQKRQALSIDKLCLRTTHPSWQDRLSSRPASRTECLVKPHLDLSLEMESARNEDRRHQRAHRLCDAAAAVEARASKLCEENQRLVQRCCKVAQEMSNRTRKALEDWTSETRGMVHRVEAELQSVDAKIEHMKRTMRETSLHCRALEEPMHLCCTRGAWRKQRAHDEDIVDPVSAKLSQHRAVLIRTEDELRALQREERSTLLGLVEHRASLAKDLSNKREALETDVQCISAESMHGRTIRLTGGAPRVAGSGACTRRPTSVPVGGCLSSRRTRPANAWT